MCICTLFVFIVTRLAGHFTYTYNMQGTWYLGLDHHGIEYNRHNAAPGWRDCERVGLELRTCVCDRSTAIQIGEDQGLAK